MTEEFVITKRYKYVIELKNRNKVQKKKKNVIRYLNLFENTAQDILSSTFDAEIISISSETSDKCSQTLAINPKLRASV